jgi:hypothetical protein
MWLIFVISVICIFIATMFAIWITNKVLISIRKDNHKCKLEISNDFEHKNKNTKGEKEE